MAVFEKNVPRKVCLDDTLVLRCLIVNTQNIQGHTEYIIRVDRVYNNDKCWKVYKRYNDFVALHHALQMSSINLPLPPKKYINNFDREFIAERQAGLQKYLNIILMNPILASSLPVRRFLDPENYNRVPFQDLALQYVSMALRGDLEFEVVKPIPDIGWRIRKQYFQVKRNSRSNNAESNSKDEFILAWCEYGPDKYISDKDMQAVFKSLATLQSVASMDSTGFYWTSMDSTGCVRVRKLHGLCVNLLFEHPNIAVIESCGSAESGAYTVRRFKPEGTLRDLMCHCKPKLPFLKKYANPKQCSALPLQQVTLFCSQILHTLIFLKEKGIPYGHLHTSNIILENNIIKLLDIENGLLGVPSYYRPFFMQFRKITTLEAVDVYCFGHVLYEMLYGHQLQQPVCDNYLPDSCPSQFKPIIEAILSSNACRSGLPTLESLANMPVFSSCRYSLPERPHIKMSVHVKEILRESCQKSLTRMEDEQRKIRHQKRLVKMQEVLSAEGERKTEKKKNKIKMNGQKRISDPTSCFKNGHFNDNHTVNNSTIINGVSPERSDSPNSTSTATSAGTVTPPAAIPPPPLMPTVNVSSPVEIVNGGLPDIHVGDNSRSALLGSICNFNKSALRKTKQNV